MNIIKFKDIECPSVLNGVEIGDEARETFNKYFRGHYCYAIRMSKIYLMIPEDAEENIGIKPSEYIKYERGAMTETSKPNAPVLTYKDYKDLIDERNVYAPIPGAGSDFFETLNVKFDKKDAINMNDIYNYRQRVASYIFHYGIKKIDGKYALGFLDENNVSDFCANKLEMIKYYADDMNSDALTTIKSLQDALVESNLITTTTPSCGCSSTSISTLTSRPVAVSSCGCQPNSGMADLSSLLGSIGGCDMYQMYRRMMKIYMIQTFSDVSFWASIASNEVAKTALVEIIDLTEDLVRSGISIFNQKNTSFDLNYPCGISGSDARFGVFVQDMSNFTEALKLILAKDFTRSAFINTSLSAFATYYEYLQWKGYTVNIFNTDENYD